jgi:hypothetical protein
LVEVLACHVQRHSARLSLLLLLHTLAASFIWGIKRRSALASRFSRAPLLSGSVAGGLLAQAIIATFGLAYGLMRDIGFTPARGKRLGDEIRSVVRASIVQGLGKRPVQWIMLEAPFTGGVTIYAFYAMQP